MNMEKFEEELKRLLAINYQINSLSPETDISVMDSLACTEVAVLAEEQLGVSIEFQAIRRMKTYAELKTALESK